MRHPRKRQVPSGTCVHLAAAPNKRSLCPLATFSMAMPESTGINSSSARKQDGAEKNRLGCSYLPRTSESGSMPNRPGLLRSLKVFRHCLGDMETIFYRQFIHAGPSFEVHSLVQINKHLFHPHFQNGTVLLGGWKENLPWTREFPKAQSSLWRAHLHEYFKLPQQGHWKSPFFTFLPCLYIAVSPLC